MIRYGGEEFLIILQDTSEQSADSVAEKIRAAVEAMKIQVGGIVLQKTISIGISASPGIARPSGRPSNMPTWRYTAPRRKAAIAWFASIPRCGGTTTTPIIDISSVIPALYRETIDNEQYGHQRPPRHHQRRVCPIPEADLQIAGISLADSKKVLLVGRLGRRLAAHNLGTFTEYYPAGRKRRASRRVADHGGSADHLERNLDFFREEAHFEFLAPTILAQHPDGRPFDIWERRVFHGRRVSTRSRSCSPTRWASTLHGRSPDPIFRRRFWPLPAGSVLAGSHPRFAAELSAQVLHEGYAAPGKETS